MPEYVHSDKFKIQYMNFEVKLFVSFRSISFPDSSSHPITICCKSAKEITVFCDIVLEILGGG